MILLVTLGHFICNHLKFFIIPLKRGTSKTFFSSFVTLFLQGKKVNKPLSELNLKGLVLLKKRVYVIKLFTLFYSVLLLAAFLLQEEDTAWHRAWRADVASVWNLDRRKDLSRAHPLSFLPGSCCRQVTREGALCYRTGIRGGHRTACHHRPNLIFPLQKTFSQARTTCTLASGGVCVHTLHDMATKRFCCQSALLLASTHGS